MSSFGLYKGSGGGTYDRSVISELYNAPRRYKRDLCKNRTCIDNPRLNISMLGHPESYIRNVREERIQKDDGLMQRFLFCAPEPAFYSAEYINTEHERCCAIEKVFCAVYYSHEKGTHYVLSQEAHDLFCDYYSDFKNLVRKTNLNDVFLR
jgi:Protein of unknown function (DUF3987)